MGISERNDVYLIYSFSLSKVYAFLSLLILIITYPFESYLNLTFVKV